jgi:signal transduction histidine kinase
MLMSSTYSPKDLPKLVVLVALYVLLARTMVLLFGSNDVVGFLWLTSGVALAVVLLDGYRALLAIFLGAFLGFLVTGASPGFSLVVALRHVAAIFLGAWALQREGRFDPALRTLPDFLRILVLALGLGVITAVFMVVAGGLSPSLGDAQSFNQRWAGHTLGIIVIMPLVLVWRRLPREWATPRAAAEAALILGLSFLIGQIVFLDWFQGALGHIARGHWLFLAITLAAVRLGPHGAVLILATAAIQAAIGAHLGKGFFADDIATTQLTNYFLYTLSLSAVSMTLAIHVRGLRQAQVEILATKSQLQATLDAVPDLLFEVGLNGRIYDYHTLRTDLLAAPAEAFIGKLFSEVLPPDVAKVCLSSVREASENNCSVGKQYALDLPQGMRWFELSVASKPGAAGLDQRFIVLSRDITRRKQVEVALMEHATQLQALSGQVMEAQETERRRLAIDLHDELGQALTAIKINLQAQDRFSGQTRAELNTETVGMVEDALRQVRRLALALRPPMLDDLGLVPALRWIAEHTEAHDDLVVRVHANNLASRPAPKIETACFRIAQESLTNIVRHAKAHFVEIDLSQDVDALVLCVKDDGCGFDVAAMRKRALAGGSMGMLGMQERAALIGGQLDIASAPGQGSRVRLSCPLRTQTAAA